MSRLPGDMLETTWNVVFSPNTEEDLVTTNFLDLSFLRVHKFYLKFM